MALPSPSGPPDLHRLDAAPAPPEPPGRGAARRGWLAVAGFAPGALLGAQLAGLIFFLNPELPFRPLVVARGFALYGALGGIVSWLAFSPWLFAARPRAVRALPWALAAALAAAAWLDGVHASRFAYYLPPAINNRLIKTALWLGLAALLCFYTALLHSLQRRRYGWRSRLAIVLVSLLSLYVVIERRAAYSPRPAPVRRPAVVEARGRPELWVIGIEGATLDAILPLTGAGHLPFLGSVLQEGSYARLASISPTRREALWTTLATGKLPFQHGVSGWRIFSAPFLCSECALHILPTGIRFGDWGLFGSGSRPELEEERKALALWEIFGRLGVSSGVVGWPRAGGGEEGEGFVAPERLFVLPERRGAPGSSPIAAWVAQEETSPSGIPPALLEPFPAESRRRSAAALATDSWRLRVAVALRREVGPVKAEFLLLPGLREPSRRSFAGFSAVQFDGSRRREAQRAAAELAAYYAALDRMLSDLWATGSGPRILALVSAHGTRSAQGWERVVGGVSTERSMAGHFSGAPDGMLLLYGSGIRRGELVTGARLVDVVPTLLYALGLPTARDFDGRILTGAFERDFLSRNPVSFLPSFEGLRPAPLGPVTPVSPVAPER